MLLPFFRKSWRVGVLNSAILTVFTIGLSLARLWRAFGIPEGFEPPKPTPPHYTTVYLYIIYYTVSLTTGPRPVPKSVLHTVRSSASAFSYQQPLVSLRPSGSCLHLLPRLPVTFNLPSIFLSLMCFRRKLTSCSKFLLKKLTVVQWLKKFPTFYKIRLILSSQNTATGPYVEPD